MNRTLPLVFAVLFFAGILAPAYAQTSENVVINEVDINPPGDDSFSISEWIELHNPTDFDIDLSGWSIASTTALKKTMTIPSGTVIKSGQFLTYSYQSLWFTDVNESIELRDENKIVIDKTPFITDLKNDFTSWQRIYDGFDSDSPDDWKFVTSTAGSSNGKLVKTQTSDDVRITASSAKPSYLFGEVATISGSVSKEVFVVKPFFKPEQIVINISGPNFDKTVNLYPDLNLNYKTTLSLHQVLGINPGNYDVTVSYGTATATTSFSVGYEITEKETKQNPELSIVTDKSQYIPGQSVSITGFATDIIPFVGMKFTVTDFNGNLISNGNLFPVDGKFKTNFFITNVNPTYGTYTIAAEYFDRSASTTFEVVKDLKEDVPISLWADKKAYGLGDEVKISGRLNKVFVGTLDLEIIQTKQTSILSSSSGSTSGFKILDSLTVKGDGSFNYSFMIPDNSLRLGDYRISVSKDIGSAKIIIPVVTDPENFVPSDKPLTVTMDMDVYEFGDTMKISGNIKDPYSNSSYGTGAGVKISISHEDGTPLEITSLSKNENVSVGYSFSAIPETSGRYSVQVDVSKNIFAVGNYVVKSQYLGHTVTDTFSIEDSLDLKDGPVITLDKEVYGLGETVHLNGVIPPIGDNFIKISITKPDGSVSNSGTTVENQRFSWTWVTPISEKPAMLKIDVLERDVTKSNFGVYKMNVATSSKNVDLFFKVSADPENDSLSKTPLFVSSEKSLYKAGEKLKVVGNVIKRQQGSEGLVVPERVTIKILDGKFPYKQIHESSVYPNQGGSFSSLFELPATVFSDGLYKIKASYSKAVAQSEFSVTNDFVFGLDEDVTLLVSTDKSEYYPGDVVYISGKPNKLIYLEFFDVSIVKKSGTEITCGSFVCGTHTGPVSSIRPSPSGTFTHQFVIPDNPSAIGTYEVTVDADFEKKSIKFNVVEKPLIEKLNTVIEKENRLPEKFISIITKDKISDGTIISPRVISGSLITPIRGDESNVNLKVSAPSGTCIIGPSADCLVKDSTREQGQIYDVVDVDGISLKVRYSGPDVRLEKFSILPESSNAFLPDANWNVVVLKDDQVSRFYYKVTYKTLE
ncbi:MAG: lamin tail domain-containing protein [Nitrosopumilus sp.]|uniref:lamin tail domain-containing protein n=1 Tax=Nitrosopumilus sp. TaxID=2024843 RepID=UPI00246DDE4C|nr:lamin tail domain-containing protein [Nitrosopumilus sp.]MDH5431005.1 lamin tail domain-containing protein [Nitrosopumilus sp.]